MQLLRYFQKYDRKVELLRLQCKNREIRAYGFCATANVSPVRMFLIESSIKNMLFEISTTGFFCQFFRKKSKDKYGGF